MANPWKFERDGVKVEIDAQRSGQIVLWEWNGKVLVDTPAPTTPLSLELVSGERISFVAESTGAEENGVRVLGRLGTVHKNTSATIIYRVEAEGQRIRVQCQLGKPDIAVREVVWALPLALSPRKR
ncbi:MAG: hypothetical protein WC340_16965, partial [Kiritimatiellia bacterium]